MECWACHRAAGSGLACDGCGAILPPRAKPDMFALLGLPRRFALDAHELEARRRELARLLHPDRWVKAPARERLMSLQAATALNDAYRTLRSPVARAEHLLELMGSPLDEKEAADPELLEEMLDLGERSAAARQAGDEAALGALAESASARREAAMRQVGDHFAEAERDGDNSQLDGIKERLTAARYLQRFLDELGREEA